jgi:hypothetical protein
MRIQDAESSPPRRGSADELGKPLVQTVPRRFRWRAVIHSGKKVDSSSGGPSVSWHLADCDDPASAEAHCEIGRHLIATDGNPDGHCQVGGTCPRCPEVAEAAAAAAQASQPTPPPEPQPSPEPTEPKASPEQTATA